MSAVEVNTQRYRNSDLKYSSQRDNFINFDPVQDDDIKIEKTDSANVSVSKSSIVPRYEP